MILGIVGAEAAKFTPHTEARARALIRHLLQDPAVEGVSSGHCHLGGIDIWAEQLGRELNKRLFIYPPRTLGWETGYRPRNVKIAEVSDVVACITLKVLPASYSGMRFDRCYHCNTASHVKSGGCWTARYAQQLGKKAVWYVISEQAELF